MAEKKKIKKKPVKKKEACEIFEVKKDGKEKIVKSCGIEESKPATKVQIEKQNKILKNFFIGLGIILLIIIFVMLFLYSVRNFNYEGVKFEIVKEGDLILYNTKIPIYSGEEHTADYNFYLRNDPRKLKNIEFDGELFFLTNMVINTTEDFNCGGDGVIALANLVNLYQFMEVTVMRDENANCDDFGNYAYLNIQPGNKSKIEKYGPVCYNLYVKDCEILEVTERFMVETFVNINKQFSEE